jgi:hypothetical protein
MDSSRTLEFDLQIKQLKSENPEVYGWIELKLRKDFLKQELSSDDPAKNCDENRKELEELEEYMQTMKKNNSSIMLYEAVVSARQKVIEKSGNVYDK